MLPEDFGREIYNNMSPALIQLRTMNYHLERLIKKSWEKPQRFHQDDYCEGRQLLEELNRLAVKAINN